MELEADRKLDGVCPRPDLRVVLRLMVITISWIDFLRLVRLFFTISLIDSWKVRYVVGWFIGWIDTK